MVKGLNKAFLEWISVKAMSYRLGLKLRVIGFGLLSERVVQFLGQKLGTSLGGQYVPAKEPLIRHSVDLQS